MLEVVVTFTTIGFVLGIGATSLAINNNYSFIEADAEEVEYTIIDWKDKVI